MEGKGVERNKSEMRGEEGRGEWRKSRGEGEGSRGERRGREERGRDGKRGGEIPSVSLWAGCRKHRGSGAIPTRRLFLSTALLTPGSF